MRGMMNETIDDRDDEITLFEGIHRLYADFSSAYIACSSHVRM
jgi:hypothetical protein